MDLARATLETELGVFVATYSKQGLAGLSFPSLNRSTGDPSAGTVALSATQRRWHQLTSKAVRQTMSGKSPGKLPPLDLRGGTAFQQSVWRQMLRIPSGATTAYGEIARALNKPGATRAVGSACGANPIPVLIPCHRVLAAGGRLGGFSGGLATKRQLLRREDITWKE